MLYPVSCDNDRMSVEVVGGHMYDVTMTDLNQFIMVHALQVSTTASIPYPHPPPHPPTPPPLGQEEL